MTLKYSVLFTVELRHEYFSNDLCQSFSIVPSTATKQLMARYGLLCKTMGNMLIVLVKTNEVEGASTPIPAEARFSFYLQIEDPHFLNVSDLSFHAASELFLFSNSYETKVGNTLYLNNAMPTYDSSQTYKIGSLKADNANKAYEAILPSDSGDAHDLAATAYWKKKDHSQYVHPGDLEKKVSGFYEMNGLAMAKLFNVDIYRYDADSDAYDAKVANTLDNATI